MKKTIKGIEQLYQGREMDKYAITLDSEVYSFGSKNDALHLLLQHKKKSIYSKTIHEESNGIESSLVIKIKFLKEYEKNYDIKLVKYARNLHVLNSNSCWAYSEDKNLNELWNALCNKLTKLFYYLSDEDKKSLSKLMADGICNMYSG